jgi:hypothetical protein
MDIGLFSFRYFNRYTAFVGTLLPFLGMFGIDKLIALYTLGAFACVVSLLELSLKILSSRFSRRASVLCHHRLRWCASVCRYKKGHHDFFLVLNSASKGVGRNFAGRDFPPGPQISAPLGPQKNNVHKVLAPVTAASRNAG